MSLYGNNNPCPDLIAGQKCGITYTGARYVPLFADPAEWSNSNAYEPLTIVIHDGNSYTSKTFVPVGVDINNEKYWALTGNYNAQVEAYRQEVKEVQQNFDNLVTEIDKTYTHVNNTMSMETINQKLSSSDFIIFDPGEYRFTLTTEDTGALNPASNTTIYFNNCTFVMEPNELQYNYLLFINKKQNIRIFGSAVFDGNKDNQITVLEWGHCMHVKLSSNIDISGMTLKNATGDGIHINTCRNVYFHDNICEYNRRQGVTAGVGTNIFIYNNVLRYTKGTSPEAAIDIESNYEGAKSSNASYQIYNNIMYGNNGYDVTIAPNMKFVECIINDNIMGSLRVSNTYANGGAEISLNNNEFIKENASTTVPFIRFLNVSETFNVKIKNNNFKFSTDLSSLNTYNRFLSIIPTASETVTYGLQLENNTLYSKDNSIYLVYASAIDNLGNIVIKNNNVRCAYVNFANFANQAGVDFSTNAEKHYSNPGAIWMRGDSSTYVIDEATETTTFILPKVVNLIGHKMSFVNNSTSPMALNNNNQPDLVVGLPSTFTYEAGSVVELSYSKSIGKYYLRRTYNPSMA